MVPRFLEPELRVRPPAGERLCYASSPITALPEGAEACFESYGVAWVLRKRVLQPGCPPARQALREAREGGALPEVHTVSPFVNAAISLPECKAPDLFIFH